MYMLLAILHGPSVFAVRRKFMESSIIGPALSLLMKHLVIGQHQKSPNFSAFHDWSSYIARPVNVRSRAKIHRVLFIGPALSLVMKHLVIGQHQKAPNFSAFHWSPHGSLVSIGQHFVSTR